MTTTTLQTTTTLPTYCDEVFVGGLSFLFYAVGFVSSSLLLLFVPKLYSQKHEHLQNASYPSKAVKDKAAPKEQDRKLAYYNQAPGNTTGNNYEDLETKKPVPFPATEENNHVYRIVDPGSSKKLEVRLVTGPEDVMSDDYSHVYFILEPGTNKVKSVHMGTGPTESMKPDHVYFVLEPNSAAQYE